MDNEDLLNLLQELEVALHQPEVRGDRNRLDGLLHESFVEFGRSGRVYDKVGILEQISHEKKQDAIWSQDFEVIALTQGVALLAYRSAYVDEKGNLYCHTNRSSLWQKTEFGWQMRFHQGTPTEPFEKNPN